MNRNYVTDFDWDGTEWVGLINFDQSFAALVAERCVCQRGKQIRRANTVIVFFRCFVTEIFWKLYLQGKKTEVKCMFVLKSDRFCVKSWLKIST